MHLNHSAEVIVGDQASISLLNINMGDVADDHKAVWFAMGDTMKNFISNGVVLDKLDIDALMKESREAHLLTVNIKNLWMMLWHRKRQNLPKLDLCR